MISSWHEKRASREEGLPLRFSGKGSGKMDMWNERKADVGLWGGVFSGRGKKWKG